MSTRPPARVQTKAPARDQAGFIQQHAGGRLGQAGRHAQVFHAAGAAPAEGPRRIVERAGDDAAVVDRLGVRAAAARLDVDVAHAAGAAPDEGAFDAVGVERGTGDLARVVEVVGIHVGAAEGTDIAHRGAVVKEGSGALARHQREGDLPAGVDVGISGNGAGAEVDHAIARGCAAMPAVRLTGGGRLPRHGRGAGQQRHTQQQKPRQPPGGAAGRRIVDSGESHVALHEKG